MNFCNICKKPIMCEEVFMNSKNVKDLQIETRKNLWSSYKNNWPEEWNYRKYATGYAKQKIPPKEWDWEYQHSMCRYTLGYCGICDELINSKKIYDDKYSWKVYHAECYERKQKKEEESFNQITNWIIENLDEENLTDSDPFENRWDGITRP